MRGPEMPTSWASSRETTPTPWVRARKEALLDQADGVADLLVPAGGDVVARAADLVEAVEQPRSRQRLEEIEHPLPLADAVQEDGGAAAEGAAHVEAPGAEPDAVRGDALQLRRDHPQVLRAPGHLDLADHLGRPDIGQLAGHGGDVVGLGGDGRVLRVGQGLAELLVAAVPVPADGV